MHRDKGLWVQNTVATGMKGPYTPGMVTQQCMSVPQCVEAAGWDYTWAHKMLRNSDQRAGTHTVFVDIVCSDHLRLALEGGCNLEKGISFVKRVSKSLLLSS